MFRTARIAATEARFVLKNPANICTSCKPTETIESVLNIASAKYVSKAVDDSDRKHGQQTPFTTTPTSFDDCSRENYVRVNPHRSYISRNKSRRRTFFVADNSEVSLSTAIGTGPADPAAAGPIIWQTRIFMFTLYQFS